MTDKAAFTWGALLHMLGLQEESSSFSKETRTNREPGPLAALARSVDSFSSRCKATIGFDPPDDVDSANLRLGLKDLEDIVARCGKVLSPDPPSPIWPDLAGEPMRSAGRTGKADSLVSRDSLRPFPRERDNRTFEDVALATCCYLLRGCSLFFCRVDSQRDLNAAKTALNDFHQAYCLAWRLYHNLPCNHHAAPGAAISPFLDKVLKGVPNRAPRPIGDPSGVPAPKWTGAASRHYLVWGLLLLADVFRANIYRHIDFLDEADRYYRHARTRFDLLCDRAVSRKKPVGPNWGWFACPTLLHALLERSKVLSDLGRQPSSLLTQMSCIRLMLQVWSANPEGNKATLDALGRITAFLDAERRLPIFDRDMVTWHFGDPSAKPRWTPSSRASGNSAAARFSPRKLVPPAIHPSAVRLATEVLAQTGFTLFTITRHGRTTSREKVTWLDLYCRFDQVLKTCDQSQREPIQQYPPAPLGCYCQTLYSQEGSTEPAIFGEQIERRFAMLLRQVPEPKTGSIGTHDAADEQFHWRILHSTTQNISNIVTIPRRNQRFFMRRGYKHRKTLGDLSKETVTKGLASSLNHPAERPDRAALEKLNKLVVLRRWQSVNPKMPHPPGTKVRGGGYFLLWHGKGIVIDPGFDFIQNFYDQGFSLEDIDAIVVTHSHPDHDDDLSTLTTLFKEWNDASEHTGREGPLDPWDLFLNESTHKKFSSWLQASAVRIGRIVPLPTLCWDKETARPEEGGIRGANVILDLCCSKGIDCTGDECSAYDLKLEVVPAWHDDVIGKTASVGLKFHLYPRNGSGKVGTIGYTGDTGAYGLAHLPVRHMPPITEQYSDCNVLIAHVGDIRLRELASVMEGWSGLKGEDHPLVQLVSGLFEEFSGKKSKWSAVRRERMAERVRSFLHFSGILDLVPPQALSLKLPVSKGESETTVRDWLRSYVEVKGAEVKTSLKRVDTSTLALLGHPAPRQNDAGEQFAVTPSMMRAWAKVLTESRSISDAGARTAYRLLALCAVAGLSPWRYRFHLGIGGTLELFKAMWKDAKRPESKSAGSRLFVVGELPEELASHRHVIACWLNRLVAPEAANGSTEYPIHAITGDIGLHIGLGNGHAHLQPTIRCAFCNYNNELVCKQKTYHAPGKIKELVIKRQHAAMIYLCLEHDHFPELDEEGRFPRTFLNLPERPLV
jgi:hypothetical protein